MLKIFGFILILAGIIFGCWFGLWICFIGGIVDLVNVCKSSETDACVILWGILKVCGAGFFGFCCTILACLPGFFIVMKPTSQEIQKKEQISSLYAKINNKFKI